MGYDPFSPIAPALINVLCVPAGRISHTNFTKYLEWLRVNSGSISTAHVSSQNGVNGELLSGSNASPSTSLLLFNFGQYGDGDVLQDDAFFEPNRRPQLVLGLIDGSTLSSDNADDVYDSLNLAKSRLKQFASQLTLDQSSASLILFDSSSSYSLDDFVLIQSSNTLSESDQFTNWLSTAARSASDQSIASLRSEDILLPTFAARFDRLNGAEAHREPRSGDARRQSVASTSSRGTGSVTPQVPGSIAENGTQVSHAGLTISSALLSLQQGTWSHSLEQFVNGARAARDAGQYAWHAKALEGVLQSMLLLAWSGMVFQIPQDCYPTGRGFSSSSAVHSVADANRSISEKFAGGSTNRLQGLTALLPGLLATIMNLYERAASGFGDVLPRLLVCEARIRLAVMLITIRKHSGILSESSLEELVEFRRGIDPARQLESPSVSLLLKGSSLSNLLIESITEAQVHLPVQSASMIYLTVCKHLSLLKMDRKQGFYLKDVLQKLPPVLMDARRAGSAEAKVHTSSGTQAHASSLDFMHRRVSHGVRALLQLAAQCYGLPPVSTGVYNSTLEVLHSQAKQRLISWSSINVSGDIAPKLEVLRLCIRVSDALPDPHGSIQLMSLLLNVVRQTITIVPGPSNSVPLISSEEQTRLLGGLQSAINSAPKPAGQPTLAEYWDDFLVRGITLFEHSSTGKLMPHSPQDLSLTSASGTNKKDPFIYNPFSGSRSTSGPAVQVKNEIASFEILLQNPLEVELEIENISLIADGCAFDADEHSVVLGPLCVQAFTLKGTPKESGTLKITGCKARVKSCQERYFAIFNGSWKPPQIAKRKNAVSDESVQLPESTVLELTIVEPLPSLVIKSTSLVQRSVMLVDGERCNFTVDLENASGFEADLVLFSYEDSVSRQLQDALATKDLLPADTYELQQQLTTRPAIKRITNQEETKAAKVTSKVDARSQRQFEFSILGKPGLTEATILIDYAYIGKPRGEIEGTFYTRQLRFAVNVTVNGSVDIPRCSILSIPPVAQRASSRKLSVDSADEEPNGQSSAPPSESCLLQLDLRSIWQTPVRVSVETQAPTSNSQDPKPPGETATTLTLLPGHIDRTLVLIPKVYIEDPFTPIPSLSSNRQFVVSASKLSLEAELASREIFWYREKLCGMLNIKWEEEHGKRNGEIDVRRGIRLSSRMIDALRIEHVQITFDLRPAHLTDQDAISQNDSADFALKRNTFATLVIKVTNWTQEDLKLLLRLQPSLHNQAHNLAMDLSKKFIWSGVLQHVLKAPLKAGASVEAQLGIVAIAASTYEVNATVEEIRARKRGGADNMLPEIGEKVERRIWHARRPCLIRVASDK